MGDSPRISEAEWEIMKVVWERSRATANVIIDCLKSQTSWKPKTIRSLISRLLTKKALDYEKDGREYVYFALVDEESCVRSESRSFLKRVYDGSLQPLLAHFLEYESLSNEEIERLKELLERKKK